MKRVLAKSRALGKRSAPHPSSPYSYCCRQERSALPRPVRPRAAREFRYLFPCPPNRPEPGTHDCRPYIHSGFSSSQKNAAQSRTLVGFGGRNEAEAGGHRRYCTRSRCTKTRIIGYDLTTSAASCSAQAKSPLSWPRYLVMTNLKSFSSTTAPCPEHLAFF